jgi:hypothetical protein
VGYRDLLLNLVAQYLGSSCFCEHRAEQGSQKQYRICE